MHRQVAILPRGQRVFLTGALTVISPWLVSGAAASAATGHAAPGPGAPASASVQVFYDPGTGHLSVKAADAGLRDVLARISEKCGLTIEIGEGIERKVAVSFTALPLEQGINAASDRRPRVLGDGFAGQVIRGEGV